MTEESLPDHNNLKIEEDSNVSAYIHVPFCKQKCFYCDFNSFASRENLIDSYFEALQSEIVKIGSAINASSKCTHGFAGRYEKLKTVFIGGGTPSFVPSGHISKTLETLEDTFGFARGCEITIECNPGTLTIAKLLDYRKSGINRISIGLQSTSDRILKNIGRIHTLKDFEESLILVRKAGFDNINIDLIAGLPGQTTDDFTDTVKMVTGYNPSHISIYSLILEPGTPFYTAYQDKSELLPSEDDERTMYWTGVNLLKSNGYNHYEISNFARTGFECRHNKLCWETYEYFGFGSGAHSYIGSYRCSNENDIEKYIQKVNDSSDNPASNFDENESFKIFPANSEKTFLNLEEKEKEFFLLGFRMLTELREDRFKYLFKSDMDKYYTILETLINKGYIVKTECGYKLTDYGIDFANQIFIEFV
jgi:oxygen-independent coproporphyrinogen-3 oxidase